VNDYTHLMAQLLPTGAAWAAKDDPDTVMHQLLQGLAATFAHVDGWVDWFLRETNPATTVDLLPEWERMLGLPDPCMTPATTLQQRRDRVLGRIAETGGQSKQYLIDVCARYGYPVTITEHPYFRVGESAVDDGITGEEAALTFVVNYPDQPVSLFRVGDSTVGDALEVYDNQSLECIVNRIKPAQTFVIFNYAA
jgi:uncharacterized protein YmfQ (DUF2313 family)